MSYLDLVIIQHILLVYCCYRTFIVYATDVTHPWIKLFLMFNFRTSSCGTTVGQVSDMDQVLGDNRVTLALSSVICKIRTFIGHNVYQPLSNIPMFL